MWVGGYTVQILCIIISNSKDSIQPLWRIGDELIFKTLL